MELNAFENSLLERADSARDRLPAWAEQLATAGAARFAQSGLPHRRLEAWKYTDLKSRLEAKRPEGAQGSRAAFHLGGALEVILTKEGMHTSAPLGEGVRIFPLNDALTKEPALLQKHMGTNKALQQDALTGLNTALMQDGFVLHLAQGVTLNRPIVLRVEVGEGEAPSFARNLIVLEEGASAVLIEDWAAPQSAPQLRHAVTEIMLADKASLAHVRVQDEKLEAAHLSLVAADLEAGAKYHQFALNVGAGLTRSETHVHLGGEGAHAELGGSFLLNGLQHCDTTTVVTHAVPNCTCREVFRGVMADRSRGVFQGKIAVAPHAQKTDAKMETRALLLSDRAEMDAKPELEIYADDVKCAHGATIGTLDEQSVFYLQSRGIPLPVARRMLIGAFVEDALDVVSDVDLQAALRAVIDQRLSRLEGVAG